ncbi:EscU/YscU/HrcU family type III secretion system export apparatus switch protein [Legionella fairfieldensis]|uniref:EscU/YscU/HrcU family type III secretion system export apparatus switch protein n=1 Tax=Legionella fairfieldensis TaxID=45064 RepID=UPI0005678C1C|nr:EscU/YscU/HrcU family type III secretion system export apparatus switch protein [Legionella fairfieldensis]
MKDDKHQATIQHPGDTTSLQTLNRGESFLAEEIISVAKKLGVPLQEKEELTSLLAQVRLHPEIPPKLYLAVAQLFAFLYYLDTTPVDNENQEKENSD